MPPPIDFAPPGDFQDPRLLPNFRPAFWPLWNDEPGPPLNTADLHEQRCIEFLAGYYHINLRLAEVASLRQSAAADEALAKALAAADQAAKDLEKLEDRYAPIGFYGEPILDGDRYCSVHFHRPELPRIYPETQTLSSYVAVPGLDEIPSAELIGPATVIRWNHGKMDL